MRTHFLMKEKEGRSVEVVEYAKESMKNANGVF